MLSTCMYNMHQDQANFSSSHFFLVSYLVHLKRKTITFLYPILSYHHDNNLVVIYRICNNVINITLAPLSPKALQSPAIMVQYAEISINI